MKYYIQNVGGVELDRELSTLESSGSQIWKHEQMKCLDRQGKPITRNLWEVPKDVMEKVVRMGRSSGFQFFQFILYKCEEGNLPRDYFSSMFQIRIDPFKQARRNHRKKLPVGVIRGSQLAGA